jgi:hypothetical protein
LKTPKDNLLLHRHLHIGPLPSSLPTCGGGKGGGLDDTMDF